MWRPYTFKINLIGIKSNIEIMERANEAWVRMLIIPAHNELRSIPKVLAEVPKDFYREVIVVDNGSTDGTAEVAAAAGATVLREPKMGYGRACLRGIAHVQAQKNVCPERTVVVFMDGDYSDYPEQARRLVEPIEGGKADMVIGSRVLGRRERGSLTPQQRFGNALATFLLHKFYGYRFTDLGPFRAIRLDSLGALAMQDKTYGWTVEMQIKAAKKGLSCQEVPVDYRKRIGVSKVSGTLKGTLMAGYKILLLLFKYR